MSIINDALKKARGGEPRDEGPDDQKPVQPRQTPGPGSDFTILLIVGSVAAGILIILVVSAVWLISYFDAASDLDNESVISPEIPVVEESLRGRPPDQDPQPGLAESEGLPIDPPDTPDTFSPESGDPAEILSSGMIDMAPPESPDEGEAGPDETGSPEREDIHHASRDLRIQGVSLAEGNRRVLIGGRFLAEGDLLPDSASIRIGEITASYILLRDQDGEEVRLRY